MTNDRRRYSSLRKDRGHKRRGNETIDQLYDLLIKPHSIVVIAGAYFALFNQNLLNSAGKATQGDQRAIAHLLVLLLSVVAGARIIQSLYLAKRDYSKLDSSILDVPIFLAVLLFTSGALLKIDILTLPMVLSIYAGLALLGALNFFYLYCRRILPRSDDFDYPIERNIQAVNAAVFSCLAGLTILGALAAHKNDLRMLGLAIAASCCLLVVNMVHSQHLTMLPKFLLDNEPDSFANTIKDFRINFGHIVALKGDDEIARSLFANSSNEFRSIKTIRATGDDVEKICTELLHSFAYIFKYIFGAKNDSTLRALLCSLMTVAGGFGVLGYMKFYFIVNGEGERVGLFKIDTAHGNWLYRAVELVRLPFILAFGLRSLRILSVWRRAKAALVGQTPPQKKELRLTYLIMFPKYRRQGYGKSFLRLLQNAFLYGNTDSLDADCITLFVREKNQAAHSLFERAGFSAPKLISSNDSDPFAKARGIGRALLMERRLS